MPLPAGTRLLPRHGVSGRQAAARAFESHAYAHGAPAAGRVPCRLFPELAKPAGGQFGGRQRSLRHAFARVRAAVRQDVIELMRHHSSQCTA